MWSQLEISIGYFLYHEQQRHQIRSRSENSMILQSFDLMYKQKKIAGWTRIQMPYGPCQKSSLMH